MRSRLFIIAAIALLPFTASAQLMGTSESVVQTPFTVATIPQYPAPYSSVSLSFLSDVLDLSNTTVTITVKGKKIYTGSVRPVAVPLGKAGVPVVITVTMSSGGIKTSQTLTITPQDISLIAEPVSSAPPLYAGKPKVPPEGNVRVVAVANLRNTAGKAIDPATVSYTWTVDGVDIANSSGIGKQAVLVATPLQYRNRTVSVAVMSQNGTLVGGDSLSLASQDPTIRLYENDPLLGIRFDHALTDTYAINVAESTLYAAPFSFPTSSGAPLLQWSLNGTAAQTGNSITLRPNGSGGGNASLSLTTSAGSFSTATTNLALTFGASSGSALSNFFGL